MIGYLGKLFCEFLAAVLLLALLGLWMKKRDARKNPSAREEEDEEIFSEKVLGNVHNLNDPFNRARYMNRDGS